jgi:hypothetical protein
MVVPFQTPVAIVPTVVNEEDVTPLLSVVPANAFALYPLQLLRTPDEGVPKAGVTRVGLVANTKDPEPVDVLVTADAKLALVGVCKNVAIPVPNAVNPVPP